MYYEKGLTLNSFFPADSLWQVSLSANRPILNVADFRKIETATVLLYDRDQLIEKLEHVSNGVYKSAITKPTIGKIYKISATDEKLGTATSSSFIPAPAQISSLTFEEERGTMGAPPHIKFKLQFQDPQFVSN
jgi:hypothetical protein